MRRVEKVALEDVFRHGESLSHDLAQRLVGERRSIQIHGLAEVMMLSPWALELKLRLDESLVCGDAEWEALRRDAGPDRLDDLQVLEAAYSECLGFWDTLVLNLKPKSGSESTKRLDALAKRFAREAPHVLEWHRRTCAGPEECEAWMAKCQERLTSGTMEAGEELYSAVDEAGAFLGVSVLRLIDRPFVARDQFFYFLAILDAHYPPGRQAFGRPATAEDPEPWRGQPRASPTAWRPVPERTVAQLGHFLVQDLRNTDPRFAYSDRRFWPVDLLPPEAPPIPKPKTPRRRKRTAKKPKATEATEEAVESEAQPAVEPGLAAGPGSLTGRSAEETSESHLGPLEEQDEAETEPRLEPSSETSREDETSLGKSFSERRTSEELAEPPRRTGLAEEADTSPWAHAGLSVRLRRIADRLRDQRLASSPL